MKKVSFVNLFKIGGVLLIVGVALSITGLDYFLSSRDFARHSEKMRASYIKDQKLVVKQEVERVMDMIDFEKSKREQVTKEKIKAQVDQAFAIAGNIYKQNRQSKSELEIQQMIVDALRDIRFAGGSGYFFMLQDDGMASLFADKPELEGQNFSNMRDVHGKYVVKDLINIVHHDGEGFYEYFWTKPGEEGGNHKKISFVRGFAPYSWLIGTGLYVDDVEHQMKEDLLETIGQIRFGKNRNGYIFVVSYDGVTLMNDTQRDFIGKSAWDIVDPDGVKIIQEERRAVENPDGDYIYYRFNKPSAHTLSPKTSFVKGVADWQWMVGAGVYLDDVDVEIASLQTDLRLRKQQMALYFLVIVFIIIVLTFFLFNRLTTRFKKDLDLFISFFNRAAFSDEPIDRDLVFLSELDHMARNANKMLADKIKVQEELNIFKIFAESSSQGMGWADIHGNCVYFNKVLGALIGERDLSEGVGKNVVNSYYSPADQKKLRDEVFPYVLAHGSWSGELMVQKGSDDFTPTQNSVFVINDKNGKPLYFANVVTDISELKRVEQENKRVQRKLFQAKKMESVGLMAGGVAHDLNNILSGIVGYPELLLTKLPEDSELRPSLEAIQDSGQRAAAVVADLLTVARGVASKREPKDIHVLIQEYLHSPEAEKLQTLNQGVRCDLQFDADFSIVQCSSLHVKKCIMNLVVNAYEAIAEVGTVCISTFNHNVTEHEGETLKLESGKYIVVCVDDTGAGIQKRDLDHIFEPFYSKKEMGRSGTGLGLSVVWNTMDDHDGRVFVENSGHGTCFKLFFSVIEASVITMSSSPLDLTTQGHEFVLVVDDEAQLRELSCQMLSSLGYEVASVGSGELAVEYIRDTAVDVVVLDMLMEPGMNGYETYSEILKIQPEQKAIVVSGFSASHDVQATLELGACIFVEKPYSLADLGQALNVCLGR